MVVVSGELTIHERSTFDLNQQSRLTEADSNKPLNTLQETLIGQCRDQRWIPTFAEWGWTIQTSSKGLEIRAEQE